MNTKEFYKPDELAVMLGLNKMTIYRYIKSGKLKAYKIGKIYRVGNKELNLFLDQWKNLPRNKKKVSTKS